MMRLLLDANLPRRVADAVTRAGHEPVDVRDIGLGAAEDERISDYARAQGCILLTRDFDFADIRNYPPAEHPGIIVLDLPDDTHAAQVADVAEAFIRQSHWMDEMPGRLAIVSATRVRFRPPLK